VVRETYVSLFFLEKRTTKTHKNPQKPTKTHKNLRGRGGRGNLGFPTIRS